MREATRELRERLTALRENLVQTISSRNQLAEQLQKLEARIADLTSKIPLAEQVNQPQLVDDIKAEIVRCPSERDQISKLHPELGV